MEYILRTSGSFIGFIVTIDILILLPLCIFKSTRRFASISLTVSSYVMGAAAWIVGAIVTYIHWHLLGLIIGLFIAGVGVVPLGMLASALAGSWGDFWILFSLLAAVFVIRLVGTMITSSTNEENDEQFSHPGARKVIDVDPVDERQWKDVRG